MIALTFLLMSSGMPKRILKKVNKEVNAAFTLTEFTLNPKLFSAEALSSINSKLDPNQFYEIQSKDELVGYAYLGEAPSKADTFEFLVLFDTDFIIKKTKLLTYREDYGGEIGSKRWLKQFTGKSIEDNLQVGNGIVSISGATISVRSMTDAINNLLICLNNLKQNQQF